MVLGARTKDGPWGESRGPWWEGGAWFGEYFITKRFLKSRKACDEHNHPGRCREFGAAPVALSSSRPE